MRACFGSACSPCGFQVRPPASASSAHSGRLPRLSAASDFAAHSSSRIKPPRSSLPARAPLMRAANESNAHPAAAGANDSPLPRTACANCGAGMLSGSWGRVAGTLRKRVWLLFGKWARCAELAGGQSGQGGLADRAAWARVDFEGQEERNSMRAARSALRRLGGAAAAGNACAAGARGSASCSGGATAPAAVTPGLDRFRERLAEGPDFNAFINGSTLGKDGYSVEAPPLKASCAAEGVLMFFNLDTLEFAAPFQMLPCHSTTHATHAPRRRGSRSRSG